MSAPRYGWFGDDFTGATDTLATISERGYRAFLFLDVPDDARLASVGSLDAVGIASATRSMSSEALRAAVQPSGRFFRDAGVRLVHYKCCSTFDSAHEVGNLAVAIQTLRPFVEHPTAMILGGQPSLGRYCAFSNLFATAGEGVHRLDRHPTMSRHPATPMRESDLRRHLGDLGLEGDIVGIHWPVIEDDRALRRLLEASRAASAVLFGALTSEHVGRIGCDLRAISQSHLLLALGPSSVAEAFFEDCGETAADRTVEAGSAQVLAIAGSLSPTTRTQILAARSFERIDVRPDALASSEAYRDELLGRVLVSLSHGSNVLVSMVPLDGAPPVTADGMLAHRGAAFVGSVLSHHPVGRLIAAGGDTSSHVVEALGFWGLGYEARPSRGVCICRARSDDRERDGMQLLLKGGQMGDERLFDRFAAGDWRSESA